MVVLGNWHFVKGQEFGALNLLTYREEKREEERRRGDGTGHWHEL